MKYLELIKGQFTAEHEARAKQEEPYVAYSEETGGVMYTFIPEPVVGPADNEIWYTTVDGNVWGLVDSWFETEYGVISNTYSNGKGVIVCDRPITRYPEAEFTTNGNNLESITFPNCMTLLYGSQFVYLPNLKTINAPGVSSISFYVVEGCESLKTLILGKIGTISTGAFINSATFDLYCNNSIEEWNNMIKAEDWALYGDWGQTIHCVDGIICYSKPEIPYLAFTAEEDNSTVGLKRLGTNQLIEYSFDKSTWNTLDTSTNIQLQNVGNKVYLRGILSANNSDYNYTQFKMSGKIAASGNLFTIWNYLVDHQNYTTIRSMCGMSLFEDCTSLTKAPEIPSASWLSPNCYRRMFRNCTSLTIAPELPTTSLTENCYESMFEGCTSLTKAPELPATRLSKECYAYMFSGCSSLVIAPKLLASSLASNCYVAMFHNCTSLTQAPDILNSSMPFGCCQHMFNGCVSLELIKCLTTDRSAGHCTDYWTDNISSSGIFYKHPDATWETGIHGIPEGWEVIDVEI